MWETFGTGKYNFEAGLEADMLLATSSGDKNNSRNTRGIYKSVTPDDGVEKESIESGPVPPWRRVASSSSNSSHFTCPGRTSSASTPPVKAVQVEHHVRLMTPRVESPCVSTFNALKA